MSADLSGAALCSFSHAPAFMAANTEDKGEKKFGIVLEAANVVGYIPVIGAIVGIARIIFAALAMRDLPELLGMQCLRGALEILGLGPLMLISDAIITAAALDRIKAIT